jgi:acyl dehydratase
MSAGPETDGPRRFGRVADVALAVGERLGASRWHEVSPGQVARFAQATGTEHGGVVPAYLLLSLTPTLLTEVFTVDGLGVMLNTGVDWLRVGGPVPAGTRLRAVAHLAAAEPGVRGALAVVIDVRIEVPDLAEPACQARLRMMLRPASRRRTPPDPRIYGGRSAVGGSETC